MKYLIGILSIGFMLASYFQKVDNRQAQQNLEDIPALTVPQTITEKDKLNYQNHSSTWTLEGQAYSGFVESYFKDGSIKQRFGVLDGLKQGESVDWFADGHPKFSSHYYQGKLHGEKIIWYSDSNHHVASQLNYHMGKLNGLQKKWYSTGEIFKLLNLKMGEEYGMQQAFRKNGVLYANYEAREGRVFGLKRASLCFELENENLVYGK